MTKQVILVESASYFEKNCFLGQLNLAIKREEHSNYRVIQFSLLKRLPKRVVRRFLKLITGGGHIIILLKQRTINKELVTLSTWLRDIPVYIYDQDPWEAYIDTSMSKGVYEKIGHYLNVKKLIVTSKYWAELLSQRLHYDVEFFRMGMDESLCDIGKDFSTRHHNLGFRGAMHAHRVSFFQEIKVDFGIEVEFLSATSSYSNYLEYLANLRIMIHEEAGFYICDGVKIPRQAGLWIREIEAAARGCFVIRDWHADSLSYELDKIPLIKLYRERNDIPKILEEIYALTYEEIHEIQLVSINEIRNRKDWSRLLKIFHN